MSNTDIVIERVFEAPISLVWQALTNTDLMKQWYFDLEEFKAEKGFRFQLTGGPDPNRQYLHFCEVIEAIPEKKLVYSWRYDGYPGNSIVSFELHAQGNSTLMKFSHKGIGSFPESNPDFAIENFDKGWNQLLQVSLQEFLEKNGTK